MRKEFVYSVMALGAIPITVNAADVQACDVQASTDGSKVTYPVGKLVKGSYTFSAKLTSKVYGVKVTIGGKEATIDPANNPADPNVTINFTLAQETDVELTLVSTDPGEAGAGFTVAEAKVILNFDFAAIKSTLAGNAGKLAGTIGGYNYAAKEDDVKAANALKKKAQDVTETYDDYTKFKLYATKSTIEEEIDALAADAAAKEAAYQNEQAYNRVNAAITAIKAKYNTAVAELEGVLVDAAGYLLSDAKKQLQNEINAKITEATQASYASYQAGTAVADEAANTAVVPTETAINNIVDDWTTQAEQNKEAYAVLEAVVTTLNTNLNAITYKSTDIKTAFANDSQAIVDAIAAINTTVTGVYNKADQLTTNVETARATAQGKIETLAGKVNTANAEYNANKTTTADIADVQKAFNDAKTAVDAKVSKDGNYKAADYYAAYLTTQQNAIDKLTSDAAAAYKVDGTGSAQTYNAGLADLTAPIITAINNYKTNAIDAVDKYDALQTAIVSYEADLADARAAAQEIGPDVYTAEGYDYQTEFDLIQKRINDIKKAITAAEGKVGAEHWTAMLAIGADADITNDIRTLLSQVQGAQNQYDAATLAKGIAALGEKIEEYTVKDASKLGADVATYQAVEDGIKAAYDEVVAASEAIDAQSETVDYTAKVGGSDSWGGSVCPGDNTFAETYGTASAVAQTGTLLSQIVNVENGIYTVELYANANYTSGRGFDSDLVDGANDVAYVFANGKTERVIAHVDGGMDGSYTIEGVVVNDGILTIGLAKAKAGTNWHTIKIKSLKATTASLIDGWGEKIADLNTQQAGLEAATEGVEAKVAANAKAQTDLASSINGLQTKIGTFKTTYKIGTDESTLGNRGKDGGSVDTEIDEIETALATLTTANGNFDPKAVNEVPKTDNVNKDIAGWNTEIKNVDYWTNYQNQTINGLAMVEHWCDKSNKDKSTGDVLYQNVTNLANGLYSLVVYANAVDQGDGSPNKGRTDIAYVYANGVQMPVPVTDNATNAEFTLDVMVSDGTLRFGLYKAKGGTNWHSIQIKSLTYHENDQLGTYNNADAENLGYNDQYTALAAQESALEAKAPGIKTAVENNATANTAAQAALTDLGTYEVTNLKNLQDVSNPDGSYNNGANNSETGSGKGAKKSDPNPWYVFKTGLDADKTYEAKKAAIDATIAALTTAINDAYAAETLPYPWAGEITVTTEDDPATADVDESSSTTYKISEIKALVDALKADAKAESDNYWAYRNVNKNNMGKLKPDTIVVDAERFGAGAMDYYQGIKDGYIADKAAILTRMQASLNARTAVADRKGYENEIKALINKVKAVYADGTANYKKYLEQKTAAEETQTLWNDVYTTIAATDKSSEAQSYLDQLDEIQVELTAATKAVEDNYLVGESVAKAQDFAAIQAKINTVKQTQKDSYAAFIAADNKVAHESFVTAIDQATKAYQTAVSDRAKYSVTNEEVKATIDQIAAELDEAIFNAPTAIANLTKDEKDAYVANSALEDPTPFDVSQYNAGALTIEQDITAALKAFKDGVKDALSGFWAETKTPINTAVADAEAVIAGYSADAKKDAFKDVKDLIAKGTAGVAAMDLAEVEAACDGLENYDDMLEADLDAAAAKDIDIASAAATKAYNDTKTYINGKTIADDVNNVKADQLQNLEDAMTVATTALEADHTFANHDAIKSDLNNVVTVATDAKTAVDDAITADVANTAAYNAIIAAIEPLEAKLAKAKEAAAPYKYPTSFATEDGLVEQGKSTAKQYKEAGAAVAHKDAMLAAIASYSTGVEDALSAAFDTEKTGLQADITELKNQFNIYVGANGLDETATAFNTDINALAERLEDAAIANDDDDPANGQYDEILEATAALVKLQNDIADKETEMLAANNSGNNAAVLADFQSQIAELEETASLEGYDEWVGQQAYGDQTLDEAITELKAQIAEVKAAVEDEANIAFYKDQYQKKITAIKDALDHVAEAIAAKDAQFKANAAAYEALTAEIAELQGRIDAAKAKVAGYEYVGPGKTYDYTNYIEQYTGEPAVLFGGAQYMLNNAKQTIETANENKSLGENSVVPNKDYIESRIQIYLDMSANAEMNAQRENLNTLLTNAIDVDNHEGVEKYSSALWARLTAEKSAIYDEIVELAKAIYYSNQAIEGSFEVETDDEVYANIGPEYATYYRQRGENNQWICRTITCDADFAGQMETVAAIKAEIETLATAVDNLNLLGDANVDGKVNVLDYQKVVNMILDPTLQPEEGTDLFTNIDINQSEVIEVGDLTAIVNYILNDNWQGYAAARGLNAAEGESIAMNTSSLEQGKQRIAVSLANVSDYTAFQMDVVLPEGMTLVGTSLSDRAGESHMLYSRKQLDGSIRLLASSVKGETFSGNEGAVLYIDVEGAGSVELVNILFSDVNAQTRLFTLGGDATGINNVGTLDSLKQQVYDFGGRLMKGLKKGMNIIRRNDGGTDKVIVK